MKGSRRALECVSGWTAEVREKAELWTHTHTQSLLPGSWPFGSHNCGVLKRWPLISVALLVYKHTWLHGELCRCSKWDRGLIHSEILFLPPAARR